MKFPTFFLLAMTAFACVFAQAQDPLINTKELGTQDLKKAELAEKVKIVSASRSSKGIEDLPVTIHVISGDEIRKNGYTTLVDVLKSAPGMRVSQPGSASNGEMFLMRGLIGNSYTKILINNIPVQPFVTGTLPIGEQLPIAQAERIEVIYGPASSVYGADAMAGVINIITRTTDSQSFADANVLVGQNGYRHFNLIAGGKAGRDRNVVNYSIYGNFGKRDDADLTFGNRNLDDSRRRTFVAVGLPENLLELVNNDEALALEIMKEGLPYYKGSYFNPEMAAIPQNSRLIGIKLNYRDFTASFDEMYRQDHSSLGISPYLYSFANPETYTGETIQRYALSYQNQVRKVNVTVNTSYLKYRLNNLTSVGTNYENGAGGRSFVYQASDDLFGEVLANFEVSERSEITAGASYFYSGNLPETNEMPNPVSTSFYKPFSDEHVILDDRIGDFGYYPGEFSNFGAFLQYFYEGKRFNWVASLRYDSPSDYDARAYSRFGGIYKASPKSVFRASLGYAFKAPGPARTYASTAFYNATTDSIRYEQIPNPSLDTEKLYSFDLGFRHTVTARSSVDITFFLQNVQEQIVSSFVAVDRQQFPLAVTFDGEQVPIARTNVNDGFSNARLMSLQVSLRTQDLWKRYSLHSELHLTFTSGEERLPETGNKLDRLRMQPLFMGSWKLSFSPKEKWYINVENLLMTDWYSRYVPSANFDKKDVLVSGYHNLDFTVRYTFNSRFQAFTRITNVFNATFGGIGASGLDIDMRQNPQMGRFVRLGLSFTTRPNQQ